MSSKKIINRDNYEVYFLDYQEGRLDDSLVSELELFLLENPDLAEELSGLELVRLEPATEDILPGKSSLKKELREVGPIHAGNIEEMLICHIEGTLSEEDEASMITFLKVNPGYQHDLELFKKTVSKPDLSVRYTDKESLKHRPILIFPRHYLWAVSVAAAFILIFLGWRLFFTGEKSQDTGYELALTAPADHRAAGSPETLEPIPVREIPVSQNPIALIESRAASSPEPRVEPLQMKSKEIAQLYASIEAPDILPYPSNGDLFADALDQEEKTPTRKLIGKVIYRLGSKSREIQGTDAPSGTEKNRGAGFWNLADLGVKGFNQLTDREVELDVIKDASGSPKQYSFREDDRILLSRPINQQ